MEMTGAVLLDHERQPGGAAPSGAARRLRRDAEAALAVVLGEDAVLAEVGLRAAPNLGLFGFAQEAQQTGFTAGVGAKLTFDL